MPPKWEGFFVRLNHMTAKHLKALLFVKYVHEQGAELEYPPVSETIALGSSTVQFLGPQKDYEDTNETSHLNASFISKQSGNNS
jgi:hypothetical protein